MYRNSGLGFSLLPPRWLREKVGQIFREGTKGGVDIPLPGGGTATVVRPQPSAFEVTPMMAGGAGLALGALALGILLLRGGGRR